MKNNLLKADFDTKQREFAAYIRDPFHNLAPNDVPEQRIAMYRELFFNNIDGFLSNNFPVLRTLLDDEKWFELAQDFFANHVCQTPYFSEIPEEFLAFLQQERDNPDDYPFMLELAHYEWIEMALAIAKEELIIPMIEVQDMMATKVQLSPVAAVLAYQYPVHKISLQFLPTEPPEQATYLIVYRDLNDEMHFIEITALTYRLLILIQEQENQPMSVYLQQIAIETQHPNSDFIKNAALQLLIELANKNIITMI